MEIPNRRYALCQSSPSAFTLQFSKPTLVFARHNNYGIKPSVKPIFCNAETLFETHSSVLASFNKNEARSKYPSLITRTLRPYPWEVVDAVEDHGVILLHRRVLVTGAIMNVTDLILPMEEDNEIVLWNPSIDKSVALPFIKHCGSRIAVLGVGLDPSSNIYKVVIIMSDNVCYFIKPDRLEIDDVVCGVTSDSTNTSWRTLSRGRNNGPRKSLLHSYPRRNKVRFKGALYWIRWGDLYIELISFDLNSQVFASINLPDHTRDAGYNITISPAILDDGASLSIF